MTRLGIVAALWCWTVGIPLVAQVHPQPEAASDATRLFDHGKAALASGDLAAAEADFRRVLQFDPRSGAAYTNLGVIYMRRKQWDAALRMLHNAEQLAPGSPGVRLNIGLVYYRRGDYGTAIAPFQSAVRGAPDAVQPRYLLGLCYFFTQKYGQAVDTLAPLWNAEQNDFTYLYVFSVAAGEIKRSDLEKQATERLVAIGGDSAAFHLIVGKAHLTRLEDDAALEEFQRAATLNPKLPFLHYNLGVLYQRKHDFARAKQEFLEDIAIEPDVAYDYDHLGEVYTDLSDDGNAEKMFREALRRDPRLGTSWFGLAKIEQRERKFPQALDALTHAGKLDPTSASVHYLRGQVLMRMGRQTEAQTEFATATEMQQKVRDDLQMKITGQQLDHPELANAPPE